MGLSGGDLGRNTVREIVLQHDIAALYHREAVGAELVICIRGRGALADDAPVLQRALVGIDGRKLAGDLRGGRILLDGAGCRPAGNHRLVIGAGNRNGQGAGGKPPSPSDAGVGEHIGDGFPRANAFVAGLELSSA